MSPPAEAQRPTPFLRSRVLPLLFVGGLLATLWVRRPGPEPAAQVVTDEQAATPAVKVSGATMGTTWHATVVGTDQADAVRSTVQQALDRVDASMSTWKADSELSLLNAAPGGQAIPVSPELAAVLDVSARVGAASGGAFDVTVAPIVDAWGFGPADVDAAPSPETLASLLDRVGLDKLVLDLEAGTVTKASPQVRADLSAVAKGYGVDQAIEALLSAGHQDVMVEVGGEVRARGKNPDGVPWRVGVERPDGSGSVQQAVALPEGSMATSGDYRNYREVDGRRVSHTIDPRTGQPIAHGLASVSVLHPSCAWADAWATALNVLGPEAGPALAEEQGLAALFIVHQDQAFTTLHTSTWPAPLAPESP